MASRYPPPTPHPRHGLDIAAQESVNAFLKSLKAYVRKLGGIFAQHTTELAVLERVYYKGKNQHHASLLWQRVCEMRRFGKKAEAININGILDTLRATFYGEASTTA